MSEIEYTLREEDLIAFNEHHAEESATVRTAWSRHLWIWPTLFLLAACFFGFARGERGTALFFALAALAWWIGMPAYLRWRLRWHLRRFLHRTRRGQLPAEYKLVAAPEGLLIRTPDGKEQLMSWSEVQRVRDLSRHAFLYVSRLSAIVIPRETIRHGDYESFVEDVKRFANPMGAEEARVPLHGDRV